MNSSSVQDLAIWVLPPTSSGIQPQPLMYQHGGVDTLVLKDILGHKSIATTEIYTHLSDENIKKAMESNPLSEEIEKKK